MVSITTGIFGDHRNPGMEIDIYYTICSQGRQKGLTTKNQDLEKIVRGDFREVGKELSWVIDLRVGFAGLSGFSPRPHLFPRFSR